MNYKQTSASEFAHFVKGLGFRVFLAKSGEYGFITDEKASRVLSFSFTDGGSLGGSLGGNYGPPSQASGTGWRMEETPWSLQTGDDVHRALYAQPPKWAGNGWKHLTTVEQHLKFYGPSSCYQEI